MNTVANRLTEIQHSANTIERYEWHTITQDSMGPTLIHGDMVVADKSRHHFTGPGLYLIRYPGYDEVFVSRLDSVLPGYFNIIFDNQRYHSERRVPAEKFEIAGKVIVTARAYG